MTVPDAQIIRQNPWWTSTSWQGTDPHLEAVAAAPVQLRPPEFVEAIDLEQPSIHTVRGPRQVGKSTGLKQLVDRALHAGRQPRSTIYLALDLLGDQPISELAATIIAARALSACEGPFLWLLDEVTAVSRWADAVKALWDDGTLRQDVVVCTGSSAIDLAARTVERLPGRRGAGGDHLVLPQSFGLFAHLLDQDVPPTPACSLADLFGPEGRQLLRHSLALVPRLDIAIARYLSFGGLPAAVAEASAGHAAPSVATRRMLMDSLERDVVGHEISRGALEALLERVALSLGSKTNWSAVARAMDVPLGRRARGGYKNVKQVVEDMARSYALLVVYFWKSSSGSRDLSKDKKLYFGDPLLHTLVRELAPGSGPDLPGAVENAFALALMRRYELLQDLADGFAFPSRVHVYQTSKPNEIDFVCGRRPEIDLLEVKYRKHVGAADTIVMRRAFPGRPTFLATRETFRLAEDQIWVPASLLLWALG